MNIKLFYLLVAILFIASKPLFAQWSDSVKVYWLEPVKVTSQKLNLGDFQSPVEQAVNMMASKTIATMEIFLLIWHLLRKQWISPLIIQVWEEFHKLSDDVPLVSVPLRELAEVWLGPTNIKTRTKFQTHYYYDLRTREKEQSLGRRKRKPGRSLLSHCLHGSVPASLDVPTALILLSKIR